MQVPSDLPNWVQEVSLVAVAATSVIIAVYRYIKSETNKPRPPAPDSGYQLKQIDPRIIRQLGDTLYEFQEDMDRVSNKTIRAINELNKTIQELIDEKRS